tara:strand:+ start:4392 stop:4985 length:594 start_codon:yes stop_codon:yes gene_type:complete
MKTHTDITIILDCSGSMDLIKSSTIEGFNTFLRAHQAEGTNVRITLVKFNHEYMLAFEEKKIKKKYFLNEANFVPNGTTALLDAIGSTIKSVDARIEKHAVKPGVIIAIITDGHENSSRFYTQNDIKKTIKKRSDKNNWNFMYLGANQDAIFEGNRLGISSDYSHNFKASKVGVERAFNNVIKESMKLSRNHLQANL